jgi:hypothetical protein
MGRGDGITRHSRAAVMPETIQEAGSFLHD